MRRPVGQCLLRPGKSLRSSWLKRVSMGFARFTTIAKLSPGLLLGLGKPSEARTPRFEQNPITTIISAMHHAGRFAINTASPSERIPYLQPDGIGRTQRIRLA